MSKRYYNCQQIIIPKGAVGNGCPAKKSNCINCEYKVKIGRVGNNIWVDCDYYDNSNEDDE